ncbi:tRNA 2-thiouridine(34) synthase MnmA [Candidatus Similichlamydia laticola]|uniref:tRNA-specific 2-thiouridylase MnmA n=1 Tax=Candidatus Similichlamydia laticola TaxID=2170265 RepID=A0A369KCD0_9BACT|nr:tRNA 2-thiouridine(34) synthase MnmA [Candidatus Similichlamydia laticola]RDB31568.1 tRNA-specific 2-thiouridylase MnmA [Candidatus Similichlamydia laticola]
MERVFVAMSGGVDSSLSALLLKEMGYDVIGLFVSGWEDEFIGCQAKRDLEDVVAVCDSISIPYYAVDLKKEFSNLVFDRFLHSLRSGLTPNPDIACNQHIKFRLLLDKALAMGGQFLATGHYCRLKRSVSGTPLLFKGLDRNKDQSYFLHAITASSLKRVRFPIGALRKEEVRFLAKKYCLPNYNKKDSVGICFVENKKFNEFISRYIPPKQGAILSTEGRPLGEHRGLHFFTIGQRKGLRIGGKGPPWFVVRKDLATNTLWIAQGQDHPWLFANRFLIRDLNWLDEPRDFPFRCCVKIRYRSQEQSCALHLISEEIVEVQLDSPQRAVTPGQSAVFYDGEQCLGGGLIQEVIPAWGT